MTISETPVVLLFFFKELIFLPTTKFKCNLVDDVKLFRLSKTLKQRFYNYTSILKPFFLLYKYYYIFQINKI